jgi:hypothetical protein
VTDQTIFRRAKDRDNPFVMIDKSIFEDTSISWKAKGLMGYLLSRPDNWTVRMGDLAKRSKDGLSATRSTVDELIQAGYIIRTRENDDKGHFSWFYEVHEIPQAPPPAEPSTGNPYMDNPSMENQPLTNTDLTKTEDTNKYAADGDDSIVGTEQASIIEQGQESPHSALPAKGHNGDTPHNFLEWQTILRDSTNRTSVLRHMCETLYPGLDPPGYSYIGKIARKVGGAGRLADLLWQCTPHPPTGDLLAYIQGVAKNGHNGKHVPQAQEPAGVTGWSDE